MKTNFFSEKAISLTLILLFGISCASMSSSFTASSSGNWSSPSCWGGNNPGFIITANSKVVIPAGVTILLDSDLTVQGDLFLNEGCLSLNGQNLTINGAIITTGLGSIIGDKSSDISFNGYSGAGNLMFSTVSQTINNLTINIGSNSAVFLGSDLTVYGTISLIKGFIGIGNNNLTVSEKGRLRGGASSSYVMNTGTGSLIMPVANAGSAYLFPVGTQNDYAPVAITNNSATSGNFGVCAFKGIPAEGNVENDISGSQGMVNTLWNLSSSITRGTMVNVQLFWNTHMQVNGFNSNQAYISQYTLHGWSTNIPAAAALNNNGLFSLQLDSVASFGLFAVFDKNATTSVQNITAEIPFTIYPNPATGYLNILIAESDKYPLLEIFDALGNEVISRQIESPLTSFDINNLPAGVYFASLNNKVTKRFVKK